MSGYKTFIISLLITIFGALEKFDYTQFLTEENTSYVVGGIGLVMFALRAVTKTPIFKG